MNAGRVDDGQEPQVPDGPPTAPARRFALVPFLRNALVVGALSLVVLEIILRAIGLGNPVLYERQPDVGYRLKPNQQTSLLGNTIAINAYGVRDPRPFDTRQPGKQRVVCLGDSVTWGGVYIAQEDLFTSIAERKLGNVEIVNAGVNGYSTTQMAQLYDNYLAELAPDLLVLCVIPRDFERPPVAQPTEDNVAFPEHPPRLAVIEAAGIVRATAYARFGRERRRPSRDVRVLGDARGDYGDANLSAVSRLTQKLEGKARTVVALIPTPLSRADRQDARDRLRWLRQHGVRVVDLGTKSRLSDADYVDGVHLSESGHRKIGAALGAVIYDAMAPETADARGAAVETDGASAVDSDEGGAPNDGTR